MTTELLISFLDRRGDSIRHSYPYPISEYELDTFWRKEWSLSKQSPGYILNPEPHNQTPVDYTGNTK